MSLYCCFVCFCVCVGRGEGGGGGGKEEAGHSLTISIEFIPSHMGQTIVGDGRKG